MSDTYCHHCGTEQTEQPYIITRKALPKGTECDTCPNLANNHLDYDPNGHGPTSPIPAKVVVVKVPQDIVDADGHHRAKLFACEKCVEVMLDMNCQHFPLIGMVFEMED